MPVLISMSLAVLIWSLYPLGLAIGLESMGTYEMLFVTYIIAMFGSILMGGYYLHIKKQIKPSITVIKNLPKAGYCAMIAGGVTTALCHLFFIISLSLTNKAGASLLYESWPIMAVIATPFLMKKKWNTVSFKEFIIGSSSLLGIAFIIFSDENIEFNTINPDLQPSNNDFNYISLLGYILAFVGAYMCALSVVTKGMLSEYFHSINDGMGASLICEITTRIISVILVLIAFPMVETDFNFDNINWLASFYVGYIVMVVGGALYTYALLKTDNPTIHIMYYFVPVLAVVWLWIAGESNINAGLFVGGFIILAVNIYLFIAGRKARISEEL